MIEEGIGKMVAFLRVLFCDENRSDWVVFANARVVVFHVRQPLSSSPPARSKTATFGNLSANTFCSGFFEHQNYVFSLRFNLLGCALGFRRAIPGGC